MVGVGVLGVVLCASRAVGFAPVQRSLALSGSDTRFARRGAAREMVPGFSIAEAVDAAQNLGEVMSAQVAAADGGAAVVPVDDGGWFAGFVWVIESGIKRLHDALGEGSYGVSIILFTLVIKAITFPLNYAQIESTTKMQALQPAIKRIQAKYANDPQQMNVMMAQLYQENELNPLAGCLPSFAQIPIFIALYRALLNLAKEDLLEEPFLWIPNLEGPTYGAQNADWLLKFDAWNGFEPPLGWHDTAAYLALPVILVLAQSVSTQLLKPPAPPGPQSEQMETTNAVLKYLPILIGVFSLNVPSGLTVYWFVNNLFTTASTLYIRSNVAAVTMGGAGIDTDASPKQKQPANFDDLMAKKPASKSAAKAPSSKAQAPVLDAEIVDVELSQTDDAAPDAAAASPPSGKSAEKKKNKAAKTRRATKEAKKSRKN